MCTYFCLFDCDYPQYVKSCTRQKYVPRGWDHCAQNPSSIAKLRDSQTWKVHDIKDAESDFISERILAKPQKTACKPLRLQLLNCITNCRLAKLILRKNISPCLKISRELSPLYVQARGIGQCPDPSQQICEVSGGFSFLC